MSAPVAAAAAASAAPKAQIQEFSIRVPKNSKKKYSMLRFNAALRVDFSAWSSAKMGREVALGKDSKSLEQEMPKFGAGSEFGREAREEARRHKYGGKRAANREEDQPWILETNGRKYRGAKEGTVNENCTFYVFMQNNDGTSIDAYPLQDWYNFQAVARYKALSAEEAEEQFSRRNKIMDYFSLMMRKRLRDGEEEEGDEDCANGETKKSGNKSFKISEMDEWMDSDDEDESVNGSDDDGDDEKKKKKKKKKKKGAAAKKKTNAEALEESDDGDEEGRECEYMSDSSESEAELEKQKEIKSVAEEDGLRKLLSSDEDDEEDEREDNDDDEEDDEDTRAAKNYGKQKRSSPNSGSNGGSDSDESKKSGRKCSAKKSLDTPKAGEKASAAGVKRALSTSPVPTPTKKPKTDSSCGSLKLPGLSESGIAEEDVRRYLARKPTTMADLVKKFVIKAKKAKSLSKEDICLIVGTMVKRIDPAKRKVNDKTYYYIEN